MSDKVTDESETRSNSQAALPVGQRLASNTAIEAGCRLSTMIIALVIVPVIVSKLGVAGYGVWETVLAVASLCTLFQLAITGTMLWSMSRAYGMNDMNLLRRLAGIGISANFAQMAVAMPIVWFLRHWLVAFFKAPVELALILPVVVGLNLLGGLNETIGSAISSAQRMGLNTLIRTGAILAQYATTIVGLICGYGYWSLVAGQACNFLVSSVASFVIARRVLPSVSFLPVVPHRAEIRELYGYASFLMVGCISAALRGQTDRIVLARFATSAWVGYYGIATRLCSLIFEFNRYFYMPLIPATAAMQAQGNASGIRRLYSMFMLLTSCATGAMTVLVLGLYDRLMVLWIGHYIPQVTLILLLLTSAGLIQLTFTGPGTSLCRGLGRAGVETSYLAVNLILNIALTILLVKAMGFIGTVIASAVSMILSSAVFVVALHRIVDLPVAATLNAARNVVAVTVVVVLMRLLSSQAAFPTTRSEAMLSCALWGALGLILYSGLLLLCGVVSLKTVNDLTKKAVGFSKGVYAKSRA